MKHQGHKPTIVCSNDNPRLTLRCLTVMSNFATVAYILVFFDLYQSLRRLPLLKLANSQYYPLAPFARFIGSLMRL